MITYEVMNNYLDEIRRKKKIKVKDFVDGIISERSYRRYINDSKPIQYTVFLSLVQRLGWQMRDFAFYILNMDNRSNNEEVNLKMLLDSASIAEIDPVLEKWGNKRFKSMFADKILPALVMRHHYRKGEVSRSSYVSKLREYLGYPQVLNKRFIVSDEIDLLLLLEEVSTESEKEEMMPFFNLFLAENIKIGSVFTQNQLEKVSLVVIKILLKNDDLEKQYPDVLHSEMNKANANIVKNRLDQSISAQLENEILYAKKKNNSDDYEFAIWNYYTYVLSRHNAKELLINDFSIRLNEKELYLKLLRSKKFLSVSWFERMGA